MAILASFGLSTGAQTLLDEGFEDIPGTATTTELPPGWERVDAYTGANNLYRWAVHYSESGSTMSGHKYMAVDAPTWEDPNNTAAFGPRQERLLTPALELDDTYQLSLDWEAAAYAVCSQGQYTFKVLVVEEDGTETVILDITDEELLRASGVPGDMYNTPGYLWTNWAVNTSKIDLSPWKGKVVRIAFVYDLLKKTGNIVYLDNVSIRQHRPETGPVAELSQSTYVFPVAYIGEKLYSEVMTLKNIGLKGLKVTGFEAPEAYQLVMDVANVDLNVNETAQFQICYSATLASPTEADLVIKTNGGDVTLHVTTEKQAVPDGYVLELFEGEQFPPAGWTLASGSSYSNWMATSYAIEGDRSLAGSGSDVDTYISTPMLDLSDPETPHEFMFTYFSYYYGEDFEIPGNDLILELSTDGGQTYKRQVWKADDTAVNELIEVTVDLAGVESDSVMLRFHNTAVYFDPEYGLDDWTTFIIDRVLLPGVAGVDGVPKAATLVAPLDSATNVYTRNLLLKWGEAQFAEGYRLYLGTDDNTWDVIDGLDVGEELSYLVPQLDYAITYRWKVVPYNTVGDAEDVPVWVFTTQDDHSVSEFPWLEDFEGDIFAPLGWNAVGTSLTKWNASDYYPFDGARSAMAFSNETEVEAILTTPDVTVPADGNMQLSFWWGNDRPVNLTRDDTAIHTNHSTEDDGIDAVMMDINVDGEWQQLRLMSDNKEGYDEDDEPIRYWVYEAVDLTPYAGKVVSFRWRYVSHNYGRSRGAALDNVKIEAAGSNVVLSTDAWDAYKVNAYTTKTSPVMALSNLGSEAVSIVSAKATSRAFTSTLKAGDVIEPANSLQFNVMFDAGDLAAGEEFVAVDDEMLIQLSDGSTVSLPVSAIALPSDTRFFDFEDDATGYGPAGFTTMDVDRQATVQIYFWTYPNNGAPLSFFVLNDSECYNSLKEPHGHQSLMTRCNENGAFHDWIVSEQMTATDRSTFSFHMRNWESIYSVLPAGTPTVTVLVSTTSATNRNSFEQVGESFTPELYNDESWDELTYDLSEYAGQKIYIALKAEATNCLGAFYDNFEFAHFTNGMDVNGDGSIDGGDINCLINHILGKASWPNGDVNGDGAIDGSDVNALINVILGK